MVYYLLVTLQTEPAFDIFYKDSYLTVDNDHIVVGYNGRIVLDQDVIVHALRQKY
jgi:hypothetical protein